MKPKIKWEPWQPYWNSISNTPIIDKDKLKSGEDKQIPTPMLLTSGGPLPIQDIHPLHDFDFYDGHTNFYLSELVCEMIQDTQGVEAFCVLSPYRMRLAVAKMFDVDEVQMDIGYQVGKLFE